MLLAAYNSNIDAETTENFAHGFITGTTKRSVHNIQTGRADHFRFNCLSQHRIIIFLPNILANIGDHTLLHKIGKRFAFREKIRDLRNFLRYNRCRFIGHLAAIGSVALDAVVCAGIMACRYNNAATTP